MKPLFRSKAYYNSVLIGMKPLVYFPLDEVSGSAAKNWGTLGAASNGSHTGVDLHAVAGPKGGGAPYYDGVNDYTDIYSAAFAAAFNGQELSTFLWFRVYNVGVWTDGIGRRQAFLRADDNNRIWIDKMNTNNAIYLGTRINSVTRAGSYATSTLEWIHAGLTISKSADEIKIYIMGSQYGATMNGVETWSGALDPTYTVLGSYQSGSPVNQAYGYIAHFALWDRVLTPEEIQVLA